MELKNMFPNNFGALLLNKLKEKKNWFLISIAILMITVVILPMLTIRDIRTENIIFGMVEIFMIIFINCIMDFDYFHNYRKLSYYASKPITSMQRINLNIITNFILTTVLVIVLVIIGAISGADLVLYQLFIVTIPWLFFGILVATLSSIITGNSITAALTTVFNFALPAAVLAIVFFVFDIVESIALGFNADILMNSFVSKYYRIDYLYLVKFAEKGINALYFIIILVVILCLYMLINKTMKYRKNERVGEFIIYDGYKNFIAVFVSFLAPNGFLAIFNQNGFVNKIVSFIILSALSYYIIMAILEKSFRVSKKAIKIFLVFITIFIVGIVGVNIATNRYEKYVPNSSEVESVFIGMDNWAAIEYNKNGENAFHDRKDREELLKDYPIYSSNQNIESVIELHKEILNNQGYKIPYPVTITYIMKDGNNVTRYYKLNHIKEYDDTKDNLMSEFVNTDEFKKKNLPFAYDDEYVKALNIKSIEVTNGEGQTKTLGNNEETIDNLRRVLKLDSDNELKNANEKLRIAISAGIRKSYFDYYDGDREIIMTDQYRSNPGAKRYYISINTYDNKTYDNKIVTISLDEEYENTVKYVENLLAK